MNTNYILKIVAAISIQMIVLVMGLMLRLVVFGFTIFGVMRLIRTGLKSRPLRVITE